ncbi:unnamed protein product [Ixodes pacificus]
MAALAVGHVLVTYVQVRNKYPKNKACNSNSIRVGSLSHAPLIHWLRTRNEQIYLILAYLREKRPRDCAETRSTATPTIRSENVRNINRALTRFLHFCCFFPPRGNPQCFWNACGIRYCKCEEEESRATACPETENPSRY